MGLFSRNCDYGKDILKAIADFFESSTAYTFSYLTFTEIFAYSYYRLDKNLYLKSKKDRVRIVDEAVMNFKVVLLGFKYVDVNAMSVHFLERVNEYGELTRKNLQPADIFQRFQFHMDQSKYTDSPEVADGPLIIEDIFISYTKKKEILDFVQMKLIPIIETMKENPK